MKKSSCVSIYYNTCVKRTISSLFGSSYLAYKPLAYQPANSVFLSHQTSQQYFQPWLISQSSRNKQADHMAKSDGRAQNLPAARVAGISSRLLRPLNDWRRLLHQLGWIRGDDMDIATSHTSTTACMKVDQKVRFMWHGKEQQLDKLTSNTSHQCSCP